MRIRRMGWVAAAALAVVVTTASAATASAATSMVGQRRTHTTQTVLRPVSWSGHVTSGYAVSREHTGSVDCTAPTASPGAVDPDILECSPSAEYATACWLSRTPHRSLCLRDPRKEHLTSIRRTGAMAQSLPYASAMRGPLGLRLGDGTYCEIRIGGAGASLHGHPNYTAFYYCAGGQSVWGPISSKNWAVNRSHAVWTVRTARSDGRGPLRTRNVARVWFVGMHS